jgi:hypothetical protein
LFFFPAVFIAPGLSMGRIAFPNFNIVRRKSMKKRAIPRRGLNSVLSLAALVLAGTILLAGCGGDLNNPKYSVITGGLSNGSITADPAEAVAGAEITLTVSPDGGYQLQAGSLKANDLAVDEAALKFTMPAQDVKVAALFERKAGTYLVAIDPSITHGTVTASPTGAAAGATITLTLTPDEGYKLNTGTLKYNNVAIEGTTFIMPAHNVTVTAQFGAPVTELHLSTSALTLIPGLSWSLTAYAAPAGSDQAVTWSSSDATVASVENGQVSGKKLGTATITATSVADSTKKAACEVTIANGIATILRFYEAPKDLDIALTVSDSTTISKGSSGSFEVEVTGSPSVLASITDYRWYIDGTQDTSMTNGNTSIEANPSSSYYGGGVGYHTLTIVVEVGSGEFYSQEFKFRVTY